jgi:hypothetical protein
MGFAEPLEPCLGGFVEGIVGVRAGRWGLLDAAGTTEGATVICDLG